MKRSVTSLSRIYDHLSHKQQQQQEDQLSSADGPRSTIPTTSTPTDVAIAAGDDDDNGGQQSLLLAHALLLHQRRMLLLTGMLRLLNTCVQAFPALLVARLLRLMEAGHAQPVTQALSAAATLVVVLTAKMVTENLYFHFVVQSSTAVRGSLAGLLFEKSLKLPGGGSGVTFLSENSNNNNAMVSSSSVEAKTVSTTSSSSSISKVAQTLGPGGVLNLMQSDTGIIESAALQFHTTWDGPLQIAIYTTLLFRYLGPSVLWGIAVLILTIPINSVALRVLNRLAKYENEAKDARTKRTAESLSNMKLLKLQGWEQHFADDIRQHRRDELKHHVNRGVIRALNSAVSNAVPSIVLVVTLTAYVKTGRPIVASTIFTAISLFNQLRFPLFFYPMLIDAVANGRNAMRRISTFLSAQEIVPYVQYLPPVNGGGGSIEMRHGNFLWSFPSQYNPTEVLPPAALANVNLKVNPGEVVAVVGSVGSGKSALLKALLGELNPLPVVESDSNGFNTTFYPAVVTNGDIAYCSQEAWLSKGTIRDAIVFGREYDESRYLQVLRDAGLDTDMGINGGKSDVYGTQKTISVLNHDTDVGEGGSSLSGGQRARVALARALYSGDETKVFLLDDCLAALDTRVGSTVFERMISRLRKSKAATILVTNDPSLPRRCDRVILMGSVNGSSSCSAIVDIGTYDELISRGHDLRSITAGDDEECDETTMTLMTLDASDTVTNSPQLSSSDSGGYDAPDGSDCFYSENCADSIANLVKSPRPTEEDYLDQETCHISLHDNRTVSVNQTSESNFAAFRGARKRTSEKVEVDSESKILVSADENMSVGSVPRSTFAMYFKSVGNPVLVVAMVASYLMSNGAQFFQQYTVAKWTEVGGNAMGSAVGLGYLRSLVHAAVVVSIFLWIRSVLTMQVGVKASDYLHSKMLKSVFAAPMSFFDATPSGQLLSRFGKEIETVDRAVPDSIGSVLFCFLQIFMSAGALAAVVSSGMVVPLAVVAVLYVKMMSLFRPAARDMKRAETKTRSPIYTHFGEAIRGSETIRSIRGSRENWSIRHQSLSDTNLSVFYSVKVLDRWLSTRLETLGNIVVFAAAVASVYLTRSGQLKTGSAGWGLTQALAITGLLTWAVRCLTDLESNMMSVMRVKELTDIGSENLSVDKRSMALSSIGKSKMPKELEKPGEALVPLLEPLSTLSTALAPLDSAALVHSGWPWRGNIKISNISMRYNPTAPLVLKNITLSVPAGTTLGVVGRSGSGKSSLLLALFRLVEIEPSVGSILIDGVDIRSVSIASLRQSLAIIPQDPVLFTGTLAYNLDATGNASPADMLQALHAASPELTSSFLKIGGLQTPISNSHLSLGERQLICLARALLRKSKILVLDEATSSVDSKTDQDVQATIRREFVDKGVTVVTVAHRLDSVMGYDQIAVLGDGKVLEHGPPRMLAAIPGGELQKLILADRLNKRKGAKKTTKEEKSSLIAV